MSEQKKELLLRAEAKKKQLEAQIATLKADAQGSVNEERKKLEQKRDEMSKTIREAGDNFTESVSEKINSWLN